MRLSDIELALGAPASAERVRGGGLYAWADAEGVVLFIGESSSVRTRMHRHEMLRVRAIEARSARSRTDLASSGLAAVLARAEGVREGSWPIDTAADRVALRDGLVRLAAILGSTPAAQGADTDVWHEMRDGGRTSRAIISGWTHADHPLQRLMLEAAGPQVVLAVPSGRTRRTKATDLSVSMAASTRH